MTALSKDGFRPDLNGLRALAVVAVLLFHFDVPPFTGGFVGVDVFFVLSGFLMTQIILRALESNSFDFASFYLRRLARILPALLGVVGFTLSVGYFLLLPTTYARLATEGLKASVFLVNFHYATSTGYFAVDPTHSWLLHCWSLAVEFQFYIAYPALLWLAWHIGRSRGVLIALLFVVSASMLYSFFQTRHDQMSAFYLLPARAWEFAVGGLVLFVRRPPPAFRSAIALLGLILIMGAAFWLDSTFRYPSLWSALPGLGAVLIIWASSELKVLSNRVAQFLGTTSYSIYLWHWPIIAIARYAGYGEGIANIVVLLFICIAAALASFVFIETPFRDAFRARHIRHTLQVSVGAVLIAGSCITIAATGGMPSRVPDDIWAMMDGAVHNDDYRDGRCFLRPEQTFSDLSPECISSAHKVKKPTLAIWGDSLAAHLYPGIAAQPWAGQFNLVQVTASGCGAVFNKQAGARKNCPDIQLKARTLIGKMRPDVLILAANGSGNSANVNIAATEDDAAQLGALIRSLRTDGIEKIFVVGPIPKWRMALPQILFADSLRNSGGLIDRSRNANLALRTEDGIFRDESLLAGAFYLSIYEAACRGELCLTLVPSEFGKSPIQFDIEHFTRQGSSWFASNVIGPALGQVPSRTVTLPMNEAITFSADSTGKRYLIHGWMPPEGWGAWTASKSRPGVITLPVNRATLPSSVRLEFWGQLGPTLEREEFSIRVANSEEHIFTVTLARPIATETIIFGAEARRNIADTGQVRLEFRASQGKSPKEMGLNSDERVLGLGIRQVVLLP